MPDLVCFSHLRWNFVYQRPQHILSRAAADFRVHFFEEPIFEAGVKPHLAISTSREGVDVIAPVLPAGLTSAQVIALQDDLLSDYLSARRIAPAVAWYYTPMARAFTFGRAFPVIVYDCMDELSAFRGAPKGLRVMEQELLEAADVVFTGGISLYEAKRTRHGHIHAFPSSVDIAHFLPARQSLETPHDLASLAHPRIGYVGVIDERIDYDLISDMADQRPDWQIVMIGPVVKIDPRTLPARPNIRWLGAKSYDEIPRYLGALDVGFMPFALNEATRFISPTKTPEYLAAGLKVVSTPVTDVVRTWAGTQGVVDIVRDAKSAVEAIEGSLSGGDDAGWLRRVDTMLATTSWDATWAAMRSHLGAKAGKSSGRTPAPAVAHV